MPQEANPKFFGLNPLPSRSCLPDSVVHKAIWQWMLSCRPSCFNEREHTLSIKQKDCTTRLTCS